MGDISAASNLGNRIFNGPIEFPGLNLMINPSQTIAGTPIHWYGVLIAAGLILAVVLCLKLGKKYGVSEDVILDVVIIGAPSAIVGARLYYVIFQWESYKNSLSDIFKIWEGGLAIYGGLIAAVAAALIYCRVKKVSPLKLMDLGGIGFPLGQAIGRWGNFINREAFGAPAGSHVPWRMRLYTDSSMKAWAEVHPTFLYESLWNIAVLSFLLWLIGRKKFDSQVFWTYVLAYGVGRFWIEGLRTDSLYMGPLRISQVVALITAVVAIVIIGIGFKKLKNAQSIIEN